MQRVGSNEISEVLIFAKIQKTIFKIHIIF